jgi:predicted Zn-dependent peptidase
VSRRALDEVAPAASGAATLREYPQRRAGIAVPPHERIVLDNGITLVIMPRRDVPLAACCAILRGGALGDPAAKPGVAFLTAGLLSKGAADRNAFAFTDAVESVGGSFHAAAGSESITISAQFLAHDQELMLELLADALLAPRFELEELARLRARQIELLKAVKDSDPSELLATYGRAFLFRNHPYGKPIVGGEDALGAIGRGDLQRYYRAHVGADRLVLVFTGDVDAAWLKKAVGKAFGRWRRAAAPVPRLRRPTRPRRRRVLLVDSPGSTQSYFWVGGVGVDKRYPHRAALDLVNTLYGGRFTSLLNSELRIRSGLSYGAFSMFQRGTVAGEFAMRSFARTESTVRVLDLTLRTLARLKRSGVTQDMLASARAYVLGQYPLALETAADWAAALAELEAYRLGPEYIEGYAAAVRGVGLEQARAVIAEAFPDPEQVVIVLVADAARVRDQVAKYGPVTEMPLAGASFTPARRPALQRR